MKKESKEEENKENEKERAFGLTVLKPKVGICNPNWPLCGFDLVFLEDPKGSNLRENTV